MANLSANISRATYSVRKFKGMNESENSSALKDGEASKVLNFRVTDDGTITPRPVVADKLSIAGGSYSGKVTQLWSGYVGGEQTMFALACKHLFKITGLDTTPTATVISSDELPEATTMFAFGEKLYLLTGSEYYCTDGSTLAKVGGYVPTIMVGASPDGDGTLVERANLLNMQRRVRYSADGTAGKYSIPETGNVSVESVTVDGAGKTETTDYTVEPANVYGKPAKIAFKTAPAAGTDNVEVVYSIATLQEFRSDIYQTASGKFDIAAEGTVIEGIVKVKGLNKAGTNWIIMTEGTDYTIDGVTMTLTNPPAWGVVYVTYQIGSLRSQVTKMKYSELYNGAQDNRVFLYGDGSNKCVYSGIDEDGQATAEYFPDLNECRFGNTNAPLKAMVKHRNRLLAFKDNEAYSVYSNLLSLADGSLTTGFYISAVNKQIGSCAEDQAETVENRVRTLDGADIWEWKSTNTSGNITNDDRNADRISQRIYNSLKDFDLPSSRIFYDKEKHEFYCYDGSKALVQNVEADAWYTYDNFPATCFCRHNGKLYCGTSDGKIAVLDDKAEPDFECRWESVDIDFDRAYIFKYSPEVWVSIIPRNGRRFHVGVAADTGVNADKVICTPATGVVKPTQRARLKLRKFITSRLILTTTARMTVTGANISVNYTNTVK